MISHADLFIENVLFTFHTDLQVGRALNVDLSKLYISIRGFIFQLCYVEHIKRFVGPHFPGNPIVMNVIRLSSLQLHGDVEVLPVQGGLADGGAPHPGTHVVRFPFTVTVDEHQIPWLTRHVRCGLAEQLQYLLLSSVCLIQFSASLSVRWLKHLN